MHTGVPSIAVPGVGVSLGSGCPLALYSPVTTHDTSWDLPPCPLPPTSSGFQIIRVAPDREVYFLKL